MVPLYWTLVLADAAGFGTMAVGWWAVPVVALAGALFAPRGARPLITIPLGCALGWGALLLRSALAGSFSNLTAILAEILPVRPAALGAATIGLATVLAFGAALLGVAIRRPPSPRV